MRSVSKLTEIGVEIFWKELFWGKMDDWRVQMMNILRKIL
jgi:hypothetical protein